MTSFFVENAWFIGFLPLWIALLIIFCRSFKIYESKEITAGLTLLASLTGIIWSGGIFAGLIRLPSFSYEMTLPFLNAGQMSFGTGILVDNLTVLMLLIVTTVSFVVQLYSRTYMAEDEGFHRFFVYLNIFNFSMLFLVMSPNLFQMYIFWELVGLSSYLLIGFWFNRPSASKAATKAFLINRIGDFGFLGAITALCAFSFWYWKFNAIPFLSFSGLNGAALSVIGTTSPIVFTLICLGFILAMCAKSAQLPLHTWLADAMEGPTPVSALIHAATMVAAGVFLIARVYPLLSYSPLAMQIIAWIGAITALLMAVVALFQNDIKKVLAFSTSSQLGLMILALGVGGYSAGLFHLTTHAYFKALLFLSAGAVIHSVGSLQDMRYLGGLRKTMPFVAYAYLIGVCAISGVLFSGFWSKEAIFGALFDTNNFILLAIAVSASLFTAVYMFRSYFMTFEGDYKGHEKIHDCDWGFKLSLLLLCVPSMFLGWILNTGFVSFIKNPVSLPHAAGHEVLLAISISVVVLGVLAAVILYCNGVKEKIKWKPVLEIRKLAQKRFCFDEIYAFAVEKPFLKMAKCFALFDRYVVDGVVNLFVLCAQLKSKFLLYFQNGNILSYSAVGVFWLSVILVLFLGGFSLYMLEVWL